MQKVKPFSHQSDQLHHLKVKALQREELGSVPGPQGHRQEPRGGAKGSACLMEASYLDRMLAGGNGFQLLPFLVLSCVSNKE